MTERKIGLALIIGSIITGFIDRFSLLISTFFDEIYCGDGYMQPVEDVSGDVSCGFNADMYLVVFLNAILLIGITLVLTTKSER